MNETDLNLQKHWWMCQRKSLSLLQSRREKVMVAVRGRHRLQSHFLRSVFSRCGTGVKEPCPLRNEYQKQPHWQSWCLDHALSSAVQSSARSGSLERLILLNQNNSHFFEIQVRPLNSSSVISCPWPESWRAHHQMFFLKLTKETFTGFAGSRCQGILNKQIGKMCFVLLTRSDPNYQWIYTGGVD